MAKYYAAVAITDEEVSGFVPCSASTFKNWSETLPAPWSTSYNPTEFWYYIEVED